jgi:hypothetical protein
MRESYGFTYKDRVCHGLLICFTENLFHCAVSNAELKFKEMGEISIRRTPAVFDQLYPTAYLVLKLVCLLHDWLPDRG